MRNNKHQIKVLHTCQAFPCGEDEFILEAMVRAGCEPICYGCFGGGCGACKMKIVSGEYFPEKKMSRAHVTVQEQETGVVLICCVKPRGNIEIERVN